MTTPNHQELGSPFLISRTRQIRLAPKYPSDPMHTTTSVVRKYAAAGAESASPVPTAT